MRMFPRAQSSEQLRHSVDPFDAVSSQPLLSPQILDRNSKRWAHVRFALGFLQMVGSVFSLGLFVVGGVTPLALSSALVTGVFTTVSILLFRVWKRGEIPTQTAETN